MARLGMKQLTEVNRVTIKKAKNILFVIAEPDVFKSPTGDTYVVFGEAKIEDMNQGPASGTGALPEMLQRPAPTPASIPAASTAAIVEEDDEDDADVDESGLDADEISTIVAQASCSRGKAAKALRKHGNIVDAILELTP
jgi:nascent polypeptide-associated complex subunit alpha